MKACQIKIQMARWIANPASNKIISPPWFFGGLSEVMRRCTADCDLNCYRAPMKFLKEYSWQSICKHISGKQTTKICMKWWSLPRNKNISPLCLFWYATCVATCKTNIKSYHIYMMQTDLSQTLSKEKSIYYIIKKCVLYLVLDPLKCYS